jgi:tRNA nucleotidyltransferase/poly(A) polymerase
MIRRIENSTGYEGAKHLGAPSTEDGIRMPDYMYLLESRLSAEQRAALVRIQELAMAAECNLYLVGGAVRDLTSGMPIRDLDFTMEGNPSRIARELEKGGAQIMSENEHLRHVELVLAGDVDVSIAAAREDIYAHPGTKPEIRFSSIMEDLRRRDFSVNAIAISLNANSRGLLLDPTNGLADLERREVRALSIHSFTNQPVRLLRSLRYAARMGSKLDTRTADWFNLAMERGLHETISPEDAGSEFRQVAREEKPAAVLKAWEARDLLGVLHPQLAKRHPDYEAINRIIRVRDDMWGAGFRPRLFAPVALAILGRLKDRERSAALSRMALRAAEIRAVTEVEVEAAKIVKILAGPKTASPRDAYTFLEKTRQDLLAYILAESSNSKAIGKIRSYMFKWKPLRHALPGIAAELEAVGLARGPKFDKVLEDFFQAQLLGKARKLEDHAKVLRKLAGIKEPPKKVEEKKKPEKPKKGAAASTPAAVPAKSSAPPKQEAPARLPPATKGQAFRSKPSPLQQKAAPTGRERLRARGKKK